MSTLKPSLRATCGARSEAISNGIASATLGTRPRNDVLVSAATTVVETLKKGIFFLNERRVPDAETSASWLLSHVLKKPHLSLYLDSDLKLTSAQQVQFQKLLEKRASRYPLQYLMKSVPFRNADLEIGEGCFIPRPETELLVDLALRHCDPIRILDLCTGSGNIAVSLAMERPNCFVVATDSSERSLDYAIRNAQRNGVSRQIEFVKTDLWEGVTGTFDLIISNPPYVTKKELRHAQEELSYEPLAAFDGGEDGLDFYRRIVENAKQFLKPEGALFFEIGFEQARDVSNLLLKNGFHSVRVFKDDSGLDRFVMAAATQDSHG